MQLVDKFYVAHGELNGDKEIETFDTLDEALEYFKSYCDGEYALLYITLDGIHDIALAEK